MLLKRQRSTGDGKETGHNVLKMSAIAQNGDERRILVVNRVLLVVLPPEMSDEMDKAFCFVTKCNEKRIVS
jgi:hypothetical protein